jgi:hypothetical protein
MKHFILISAVILFNSFLVAQLNPGRGYEIDFNKDFINHQINILQNKLNSESGKKFNSIIKQNAHLNQKELISSLNSDFRSIEIDVKDIIETKNAATVVCRNKVYLVDNKEITFDDTLKMNKENNKWIFTDTGKLLSASELSASEDILDNSISKSALTITGYNLITPFVADRAFILDAQILSPEIFEINANLTMDYLDRQLYGWDSETDVAVYRYSSNPDNTINAAILTLDSKWARILYSRTGSNETKAYGGNPGEITFGVPVSIDVNEFGQVFVLDSDHDKIYKFQYSYSNNQLTYLGILNIPNYTLQEPMDMDYCSNESADYQEDDFILMSDTQRKSILKIGLNGSILTEYKTYNYNGVTYNIEYPTRLSKNWTLQFIDASRIISAEINSNTIDCYNVSKFPDNYRPSDISMDASLNIIVTDGIGLIHKFDFYGNYICSYTNSSYPFYQTRRISNALLTYPNSGILPFFVNDSWSYTKGSKRLLPGADAVGLQVIDKGSYYEAKSKLTDKCYFKLEIIRTSNNSVIKSYTSSSNIGGENRTLSVNKSELTSGTYKFKVSVLPYYNDRYGNYAVGWKYRETTFSFVPTLTATMSGPSYLAIGKQGTWTVTASGGTFPYSYSWSYYVYCSDIALAKSQSKVSDGGIIPNAVPCGSWFTSSSTTNTFSRWGDGRSFLLKCIVKDAANRTYTVTNEVSGSISHPPLPKQQEESGFAKEYNTELLDNYPNPFNPSTKINYSLKTEGKVSLKIYNTLGEEVITLVNEIKPAGSYETAFNASELPSGIYIYRMQSGEYVSSKKMILLK